MLGPAARFLQAFMEEVNAHSDGWAYWRPPVQAAARLMTLIQQGKATEADLKRSLTPIRVFMTRRGAAAGLRLPELRCCGKDWT